MLMVELVPPVSVAPVACPLPQGDGSVPNVVVDMDAAPATPTPGVISTPAAVSGGIVAAAPRARKQVSLFIMQPPVQGTAPDRPPSQLPYENFRIRSCFGHTS